MPHFFFFLIIRPQPRSTLFPYTTLFRSTSSMSIDRSFSPGPSEASPSAKSSDKRTKFKSMRSEEHTSELQSPDHLVCRLLLEKKKTTSKPYQTEMEH